jgi:hypothetical protein
MSGLEFWKTHRVGEEVAALIVPTAVVICFVAAAILTTETCPYLGAMVCPSRFDGCVSEISNRFCVVCASL